MVAIFLLDGDSLKIKIIIEPAITNSKTVTDADMIFMTFNILLVVEQS